MSAMSNLHLEINELYAEGYSVEFIAERLNLPKSFVEDFIQEPVDTEYDSYYTV